MTGSHYREKFHRACYLFTASCVRTGNPTLIAGTGGRSAHHSTSKTCTDRDRLPTRNRKLEHRHRRHRPLAPWHEAIIASEISGLRVTDVWWTLATK
ncbi:MAG: hypothetical protein HZT40_03970 [Candidatus Thiothrix singaporensis]|uniref:Uncharacterized protein n=1 Tax=Candidatus Thiothrix singaporensis TaxID=2799669 RepID=A0A7L6APA9_9GAMM|nr:MAG: hypothetical protein HZT40_03970 [Candidatus Thiothrix singaporensis]